MGSGVGTALGDIADAVAVGAVGFFAPEVLPAFGEELGATAAVDEAATAGAEAATAEGAGLAAENTGAIATNMASQAAPGAANVGDYLNSADTATGQGVGSTAANTAGQATQTGLTRGISSATGPLQITDTGEYVSGNPGYDTSGIRTVADTSSPAATRGVTISAPASPPSAPAEYGDFAATPQGVEPYQTIFEPSSPQPAAPSSSSFLDKATNYAEAHPLTTGAGLYLAASALGLTSMNPQQNFPTNQPYSGSLKNYNISPNFQPTLPQANTTVYKPQYQQPKQLQPNYPQYPYPAAPNASYPQNFPYPQYAGGGIMMVGPHTENIDSPRSYNGPTPTFEGIPKFAPGGIATYEEYAQQNMPDYMKQHSSSGTEHPSVGIYHDEDPNTRNLDALAAAQVRNSEIASGAHYNPPVSGIMAQRPTPLGTINLQPSAQDAQSPIQAAHGGIMEPRYSLGGYADGGNPRLLKGPGDGMSDDIPAVIGQKQPARLAEGEFVVPADVVSHLGNGSTDAGADKLHEMMDRVRKARTGNPKQGKQIDPNKFIPA